MPLSGGGRSARRGFRKQYGKKYGDHVFYAKMNTDPKFKASMDEGGAGFTAAAAIAALKRRRLQREQRQSGR